MTLKFAIPTQTLKKAVSIAARAADKRGVMQILTHIAIEAKDGKLQLTATDLELTLSVSAENATISQEGAICVPAAVFDATIKSLNSADATFAMDNEAKRLAIQCGSYKGRIATMPFEEFPVQPKADGKKAIYLPDFKRGIAVVAPASSDDEVRQALQSVYVHSLGENRTALVAADGFRLARYTLSADATGISLLLPASAVEKVIRVLDGDIDLTPGSRASAIEGKAGELSVRAIITGSDAKFPDYAAVIPAAANAQATVTVVAQTLADAIKRVSAIANEDGVSADQGKGTLHLKANQDILLVEGTSDQVGSGMDEVTVATEGEMKIALGSLFMAEAVSPWKQAQLKLLYFGEKAPLLMQPVGEPAEFVLMPRVA